MEDMPECERTTRIVTAIRLLEYHVWYFFSFFHILELETDNRVGCEVMEVVENLDYMF